MRMFLVFVLFVFSIFKLNITLAQTSSIENTRLFLSTTTDSLIVKYNLIGNLPAFDLKLEVTDSIGNRLIAKTVSGDVGNNILPGTDKIVYWNMKADNIDMSGKSIFVKVTANITIPSIVNTIVPPMQKVKGKAWIPWFYIASGVSAASGVLFHQKANQIYNDYLTSSITDDAELYHADVKRYDMISKISFGAALGFGITGVIVHIKHNQKKHAMSLSYIPVTDGGIIGLTCNF